MGAHVWAARNYLTKRFPSHPITLQESNKPPKDSHPKESLRYQIQRTRLRTNQRTGD